MAHSKGEVFFTLGISSSYYLVVIAFPNQAALPPGTQGNPQPIRLSPLDSSQTSFT